jgi:uroporphyrinogen decarboxylase
MHLVSYDRLRRELHIEPRPIRLACLLQQVVAVDVEVQDRFGADVRGIFFEPQQWHPWDTGYGFPAEAPARWRPEMDDDGSAVVRDGRGAAVTRRASGGYYFDPVAFPLANLQTPHEVEAHAALFDRWDWPAVMDEAVDAYAARIRRTRASSDRAVSVCWKMHYLQAGQFLRGYEQFLVDLLSDEPMVRAILDRLHAAYMERARRFLDAAGDAIDIVFFADDLGSQQGPLISPAIYRKLIKPYWRELVGLVKSRGTKVLMHSCGAVADFIPDLVEIGVDALNPVQITAAGMSPERLKREFGRDIAFWGGGVSTQGILDRASAAEVRDVACRNIDVFSRGGGYIFTPVHNLQANVPPENVIAAYDAAREHG